MSVFDPLRHQAGAPLIRAPVFEQHLHTISCYSTDTCMKDTILVTTQDPLEDILAAHNSAAWSINLEKRANALKWLVCARKGDAGERRAFVICEITGFAVDHDASAASSRTKYAVQFEKFAPIDCRVEWNRGQNPVRLGQLKDVLKDCQIPDLEDLIPAPPKSLAYSYSKREPRTAAGRGLTIAEAKRGLAVTYGVAEDAIRIVIEV